MEKPILYFDGACGFCRRWIERCKALTGEAVRYQPSPDAEPRAVRLVEPDGTATEGAQAVCRTLALAPFPGPLLDRLYRGSPSFARISERAYRFVAEHRHQCWNWRR